MRGIKFKLKDWGMDYYDPVTDWEETYDSYIFWAGGHDRIIPKDEVESYEWYDLCEECGYELFEEGCKRCIMEKELNDLKNEN